MSEFDEAQVSADAIEQMKLGVDIDSAYIRGARWQHAKDQAEIQNLKQLRQFDADYVTQLVAEIEDLRCTEKVYYMNREAIEQLKSALETERAKVERLQRSLVITTGALWMIKDCELGKCHNDSGSMWAEDIAMNALKESGE